MKVDSSAPNPLSAGGKYSFNCTVTSDLPSTVTWLGPDDTKVLNSSDTLITTQHHGEVVTVTLSFDPVKASHSGIYSCLSVIAQSFSHQNSTQELLVKCKFVASSCMNT